MLRHLLRVLSRSLARLSTVVLVVCGAGGGRRALDLIVGRLVLVLVVLGAVQRSLLLLARLASRLFGGGGGARRASSGRLIHRLVIGGRRRRFFAIVVADLLFLVVAVDVLALAALLLLEHLLEAGEAHQFDGDLGVTRLDLVGEARFGVRRAQTDERLERARRHRLGARQVVVLEVVLVAQLGVLLGDEVGRLLGQLRLDALGQVHVLAHEHEVDELLLLVADRPVQRRVVLVVDLHLAAVLVVLLVEGGEEVDVAAEGQHVAVLLGGRAVPVHANDVVGNGAVVLGLDRVQYDEDEIETREERVLHGDVLHGRLERVVAAVDRIGGGEDAAASVELGLDARLRDGHLALLHHLVDGRAIDVGHLVELVDAHDAAVGEHHGARLQATIARLVVRGHGRRQADTARAAAGGRDRTRRRVQHVAQHLRLGHRRIADQQHVDVTPQSSAIGQNFLHAAEQHAQHGLLDVVVAVNRGRDRARQNVEHVLFE